MASLVEEPIDEGFGELRANVAFKKSGAELDFAFRPTAVRYGALAWLILAAALAYLCRNAIGVAESTIRGELGLTLEQSGWFMGAFFWTYAIFQVPCGWFSERVGSRVALSIFALTWSAAMLGMGAVPGFWLLIVAQLAMGIAQAGVIPAACNSVRRWMPLSQRSFGWGMVAAGMQVGAIAASGLTGPMMTEVGWRLVFALFALPGFVWAIAFFVRFRDDPAEVLPSDSSELALIRLNREADDSRSQREAAELGELLAIALTPNMWWLCGQQICRAAGYMFFASWFPTFLQRTRGVSIEESGYLQGIVLVGALLGAPLGGMFTDWVWTISGSLRASRSGVGATSLATCAMLVLGAWFVQSTEIAVFLLALGAFCFSFAGPAAFAATMDIGGPRVPQVAGMMNMSGNFAAAACPVVVANIFELTANWNLILLMFAGVFLAGAICWLFVNPQRRIEPDQTR
jgi:ACS family glucarate transporter-like MFS transporter/ACS family D-galactonate transporter-like MFS transporter